MRRWHRYVTAIVNADAAKTLAMVPHRSSAALSAFFAQQGHKWCKQVKVVVTDGSRAYRCAIDARLGHARHVLDRFHVIRWSAAGLTAVRRDIQRREPPGVSSPLSIPTCSVPGSLCSSEATPSQTPTRRASKRSSTPTPGSDRAGRPSNPSLAG